MHLRGCARWVVAVALTLVGTGCASRVSHDRLLADAVDRGPVSSQVGNEGAEAGQDANAASSPVTSPGGKSPAGEGGPAVASGGSGTAGGGGSGTSASGGGTTSAAQRPAVAAGRAAPGSGGSGGGGTGGPGGGVAPGRGGGQPAPGGGAAAPGSGATRAPAACSGIKPPIVIGAVGAQSGPAGVAVADTPRAVAAWVASINAKGGLHCHPLKYIIADDGSDPARNQALTRKLVEEDHAIALVANNTPFGGHGSVKYVTEKRIPAVGSEGGSPWYYESPMYFPQMSSGFGVVASQFGGTADIGRAKGFTKVATLSCVEAQACNAYYELGEKYSKQFGMTLVYKGKASVVQPDYTSHCQAAQAAGAEMLIVGLEGNSMARVARSCDSVNYHPLISTPLSGSDPKMEANPQLNGLVVGMPVQPWTITSNPAIVEFQQVLKQYAPGLPLKAATIAGWVAAKLFETATQNLSEPPTSEGILAGLWSIKDNDLGGLTHPLTFEKGKNAPQVLCYWQLQLEGSKWISPDGGKRTCPPGWPNFTLS